MHNPDFERIGKRLFAEHLVGGNFGNMSVRDGDNGFFIMQSGAYLDNPGELVFVPMEGTAPKEASSEYRVHRAVYITNSCMAIIHAHPSFAVALSLVIDEVIPQDSEGEMFCPVIPVVQGVPGTDVLAAKVAEGLTRAPVVIARGHGTFAAGKTLDEAYMLTYLAEHSCRIVALIGQFKK
ncbi:MAG: aldolase [Methanoregula sp.]|nr:MAG: aldolase [Methanoregula sp.]